MEQAVTADVASYDRSVPGFNTLHQGALALAREIDDRKSTSAKAPLVKQVVTIVQMLRGGEGEDGLDDLLGEAGAVPTLASAADRDAAES